MLVARLLPFTRALIGEPYGKAQRLAQCLRKLRQREVRRLVSFRLARGLPLFARRCCAHAHRADRRGEPVHADVTRADDDGDGSCSPVPLQANRAGLPTSDGHPLKLNRRRRLEAPHLELRDPLCPFVDAKRPHQCPAFEFLPLPSHDVPSVSVLGFMTVARIAET